MYLYQMVKAAAATVTGEEEDTRKQVRNVCTLQIRAYNFQTTKVNAVIALRKVNAVIAQLDRLLYKMYPSPVAATSSSASSTNDGAASKVVVVPPKVVYTEVDAEAEEKAEAAEAERLEAAKWCHVDDISKALNAKADAASTSKTKQGDLRLKAFKPSPEADGDRLADTLEYFHNDTKFDRYADPVGPHSLGNPAITKHWGPDSSFATYYTPTSTAQNNIFVEVIQYLRQGRYPPILAHHLDREGLGLLANDRIKARSVLLCYFGHYMHAKDAPKPDEPGGDLLFTILRHK